MKKTALLLILGLFLLQCAGSRHPEPVNSLSVPQGKGYDSSFPTRPTTQQLKKIADSVKLISSLTFYKKFFFKPSQNLRVGRFKQAESFKAAKSSVIVEIPASGTATVIYADTDKIALLTCAHTVSATDTIFSYFSDEEGRPTPYVESVAVKIRQTLNVIGLPRGQEVEILTIDKESDLALIGKPVYIGEERDFEVFKYPWGNSSDLGWGTFVYLIGFPHGKKMISNAIVSNPLTDREQSFIINATMHQGVSGGIILALRNGVPNFELVGMANALSAKNTLVLKPEPFLNTEAINPSAPYTGNLYLEREVQIIHGITFAITVDKIRNFMDKNREQYEPKGYLIDY